TSNSSEPVAVSTFTDGATAVSITAGSSHTCAVLNTGAVNCWGDNVFGRLGDGSSTGSLKPVAVRPFTGGATAVSITAGGSHTCAVLNTGAVNCWGDNVYGQLGDSTTSDRSEPVAVNAFIDGATAVSITAGGTHTCAVLNTGAVNCWGYNSDGQLGNNTTDNSSAPVAVSTFTDGATAVSITAAYRHTCALLNTGAVNCWGRNSDGRLGNGSTDNSLVPAKVMLFVPGAPTAVAATAGDSEVVVSWTAPVFDGGSVISSYTVTSSPDNKTCTTTGALTCTVTGLMNGRSYTFTVTATNTAEDSPASTASGAVTPVTVPGVPTAVSATAGNGRATVVWTAPVSDGGLVISGYTVTSSPDNKTCAWTTGELACVVTGLTNATAYTFTVTATNSVGTGSASLKSSTVVPAAFAAVGPTRAIDTRVDGGERVSAGGALTVPVGAQYAGKSILVNLTTARAVASGFATLFACDQARPETSSLNFRAGQAIANGVITKVSAQGMVCVYVNQPTHVILDVFGVFESESAFAAVGPDRAVDSRSNGQGRVPAGQKLTVPVGAQYAGKSISVNLTTARAVASGFATLFACDQARPETSSLNFRAGQAIANGVITKVSAQGTVCVYVHQSTHVILDVFGVFPD
ncbi:fibronectin type III domain-containing protein, partial [bacterium]|nr:fibronectin type III domain-containing protein [bacterium]